MKPENLFIGVSVGFLVGAFAVLFLYFGMAHERRNIIDSGGFVAPWVGTKWTCEVKK